MCPAFNKPSLYSPKNSLYLVNPPNSPLNSAMKASLKLHKKSLKFPKIFIQSTLLPFISGNIILNLLTNFRDKFIETSCFSSETQCHCSYFQMIYYAFLSMPLDEIVPYSLIHVLLFSVKRSIIPRQYKLFLSVLLLCIITPSVYLFSGLYYPMQSPKFTNYFICLSIVYVNIYIYTTMIRRLDFRAFFKEISFGSLCLLVAFFYYMLSDILLPYFYGILRCLFADNSNNLFQIMMVFTNFIYEVVFFQLLLRASYYFIQNGWKNNSYLILLVKFYLATLYILRLACIISLTTLDWGLYLQIISLIIMVFETSTGRSFAKYFIETPVNMIINQIKRFLIVFYEIYLEDDKIEENVAKPGHRFCRKQRIFFDGNVLKEEAKSFRINISHFTSKNNSKTESNNNKTMTSNRIIAISDVGNRCMNNRKLEKENDIVRKAQKNLIEVISYQKFEFFLLYIPTLLNLAFFNIWHIPDPETNVSTACGFHVVNMIMNYDALVVFILSDVVFTVLFFKMFERYKNMRIKYEPGKFHWAFQILIYMGYQLMLEGAIGRFSSMKLIY